MCTRIVSPGFIIRSTDGSGLSALATPSSSRSRDVASGFAGACDLPLRVTYAQFDRLLTGEREVVAVGVVATGRCSGWPRSCRS